MGGQIEGLTPWNRSIARNEPVEFKNSATGSAGVVVLEDSDSNSVFVTRWGHRALTMSLPGIKAVERLQDNLHPLIGQRARRQFLLGKYEQAVFVAMKAVEIRVRKLADCGHHEMIGVDLITKTFKAGGPLADPEASPGEVEGTMMLFRSAYAVPRNPSGHREVSYNDVAEAAEAS